MKRVFVGSSTEALPIARAVQASLRAEAKTTIWSQGAFRHGEAYLEALEDAVAKYDFAVFVCARDDFADIRGERHFVARDNVIFELGLFISRLGRTRVVFLVPEGDVVHLPSDLAGIDHPVYKDVEPKDLEAEIATALYRFINTVRSMPVIRQDALRTSRPFDRRRMENIDTLLDCALYVQAAKDDFKIELRKSVFEQHLVPMKYLYIAEEGCKAWLDMCQLPQYRFYALSVSHLGRQLKQLSSSIVERAMTSELDIVSLGCGNGQKDRLLLSRLAKGIREGEKLSYFPIDISARMLVEGVRAVMSAEKLRDRVEVKGIVGDFIALNSFEPIYEIRPRSNVFSILGNSLGNSNEGEIFQALHQAMFPGDFVIIEANVDSTQMNTTDDFLHKDIKRNRDMLPLTLLGVKVNPDLLRYEKSNMSTVPGANTVMAVYNGGDATNGEVILSMIHHYPLESLLAEVESRLEVTIVDHHAENGVALILARRPEGNSAAI